MQVAAAVVLLLSLFVLQAPIGPMATRARWLIYLAFVSATANRYWSHSELLDLVTMMLLAAGAVAGRLSRRERANQLLS